MERYIALLRGINVGGKNPVPMRELKALFEQSGFSDVLTYINSGNVIFSSDTTDAEKVQLECSRLLADSFPFKIPVMVISARELNEAVANAPSWWNTDSDAKHNAIFVIPPVTPEQIFEQIGQTKPDYEKVDSYGRIIFWSAPISTFSRTRFSKIVQTALYNSVTIRNANTTLKLIRLT